MKQKEYETILENFYNLSTIIGVETVKEMEALLFDSSTGESLPLNKAQVEQISKANEKKLKELESLSIDQAFELIIK